MSELSTRSLAIDGLKILAAQVIVVHHLASYGYLPELVRHLLPELVDFLFFYGRMAVQVFLVVGGFLAANSYAAPRNWYLPTQLVHRYLRLSIVFWLAMVWIVCTVEITRPFLIDRNWLTEPPSWGQVLSHTFLLHSVLNFPSLSVGVWYVAIDFQLYVILTGVVMIRQRYSHSTKNTLTKAACAVLLLVMLALFFFSNNPDLDCWGIYFFGSYGLGVLAAWGKQSRQTALLFYLALFGALLNYSIEPRERVAIAATVALILFIYSPRPRKMNERWNFYFSSLADSSYSLFLTHFGMIVLANWAWQALGLNDPAAALLCFIVAWGASTAMGLIFHKWVEIPVQNLFLSPFKRL